VLKSSVSERRYVEFQKKILATKGYGMLFSSNMIELFKKERRKVVWKLWKGAKGDSFSTSRVLNKERKIVSVLGSCQGNEPTS
jgi:hypothetical protein